jgi:hypothetical protein
VLLKKIKWYIFYFTAVMFSFGKIWETLCMKSTTVTEYCEHIILKVMYANRFVNKCDVQMSIKEITPEVQLASELVYSH